ncbi:MAG TPA: YihY/virulence factor BrkB family protein [Candidatus Saccharimonadales bacterium]|nr:YihY/virulence factor BrkB family protein [Candidatus Saccharimonadales bacterium]
MAKKSENFLQKVVRLIDEVQQDNRWLSFPYAVIKKYGDDEAGYQGALMTYYGFLSLFPLLIVATSVIDLITKHNAALREKLFHAISNYFPAFGSDLQASVHGAHKTGLALIIGLLITLYGAKGVADAVQHALNHVWEVPKQERPAFPKGPLKSLALIIGGGIGFAATAVLSSYATAALGHSFYFRLLPIVLSFFMLFAVFTFVYRVGLSAKRSWNELLPGAAVAALGMQILLTFGTYLVTHQLKHLSGAYGRFGLVLAILFWIYLQAQVFLYAAEINSVHALRLHPRSITQDPLTEADRRAFKLYAKRETVKAPPEEVHVEFKDPEASR